MGTLSRTAWISVGVGALLMTGLAFGPCVEHIPLENGLAGYRVSARVTTPLAGSGTRDDPYPVPSGAIELEFEAEAYDQRGAFLAGYTADAAVRVVPGETVYASQMANFVDGRASGTVLARKVFGRVTLWIEDVHTWDGDVVEGGSKPIQLTFRDGTYATGVSNLIFFENPTLAEAQHDAWAEIEDQANGDTSALPDFFVEFDCRADDPLAPFDDGHGQLVVTGIFNEGFFVTDVAGSGSFNHLYAYNYSYPENLEHGDRLDRLVGTSQDFSGCTQISFPAWTKATDENHDAAAFRVDLDDLAGLDPALRAALAPARVDTAMCNLGNTGSNAHLCGHSKSNWTIEALESARVRIENVRAPDVFVNCDFNGDRNLVPDWLDSSDPEAICTVACLQHNGSTVFTVKEILGSREALGDVVVSASVVCPWEAHIPDIAPHCQQVRIPAGHICSELSTKRQFGQWVVAMDDGAGPLINVISQESLVEYDPEAEENLGRTIPFLQGNLRQVRAARPRWMVLIGKLDGDTPPELKP